MRTRFKVPLSIERKKKWHFLGYYLKMYTSIIKNHFSDFTYLDGFAGPGKYSTSKIFGSPLIALSTKFPFTRYFFVEKCPEVYKELDKNIKEFCSENKIEAIIGNKKSSYKTECEINDPIEGDINEWIDHILKQIPTNSRIFAFMDPQGLELNWSTIEKISKRHSELLEYYPIMGIYRTTGKCEAEGSARDKFFGTHDWIKQSQTNEALLDYYINRLKSLYTYVVKTPPIKNLKNSKIYCLLFATDSKLAKDLWEKFVIHNCTKIFNEEDVPAYLEKECKQATLTKYL